MKIKPYNIFLSPHNDDEALFGSYIIMRNKPLVVICTDSYIQQEKGLNISFQERINESKKALAILGAMGIFLHIKDSELDFNNLTQALQRFKPDMIYAPAIQGGHKHHDIVGQVAKHLWKDRVFYYSTYSKDSLKLKGIKEIKPTEKEMALKNKALDCYKTQLEINKPHFDAVRNKPEYYV